MELVVERAYVDEASRLDATGRGVMGGSTYSGGSHGGRGGNYNSHVSDPVYGSYSTPETVGQGARGNSTDGLSTGGGALKLTAQRLELQGTIAANGQTGSNSWAGGGAGGSVWLDVGTLVAYEGSRIEARGSDGRSAAGGGGGGRVAIYFNTALDAVFDAMVSAAGGGSASGNSGGLGSVHISRVPATTRILSTSLSARMGQAIEYIDVRFSNELNESTFTLADVELWSATGVPVGVASITRLTRVDYRLQLAAPLAEGSYSLAIGPDIYAYNGLGMDQNLDGIAGTPEDIYRFDFVVDFSKPAPITLTSHDPSETIELAERRIQLAGSRLEDEPVSILVNGGLQVARGTGDWNIELTLPEGTSSLQLHARNEAGINSEPVILTIDVDSIPPSGIWVNQAEFDNVIPSAIGIFAEDHGSGVSVAGSTARLFRNGAELSGQLQADPEIADLFWFMPSGGPLGEGDYRLELRIADHRGNQSPGPDSVHVFEFVLDTTPPAPVVLNDYPQFTAINAHRFSGQRELHAELRINGQPVIAAGSGTSWEYLVPLEQGHNTIAFSQVDRAGNVSEPVVASIHYNSEAPGAVGFQANPEGAGTEIALSWHDYDEFENGNDIAAYLIYVEPQAFASVQGLTPKASVPAGQKHYLLQNLERDQTVHVAVVARDLGGLMLDAVPSIALVPVDVLPPDPIGDLTVTPGTTSLTLAWRPSANSHNDLAGYRLRLQMPQGEVVLMLSEQDLTVSNDRVSYTVNDLAPATGHPLTLVAVDHAGNVTAPLVDPGVTLLANPTISSVDAWEGRIQLDWAAATPSHLVREYRVYLTDQPFDNVMGMVPARSVAAGISTATLAGLNNGVTYYMAVTAVNVSGGESLDVVSVSGTPEADVEGPEVTALRYRQDNGTTIDLTTPATVTHAGVIELQANDPSGLSHAEFWLDTDYLGSSSPSNQLFRINLNLEALADGPVALNIKVFDSLGNETSASYPFNISLAPPLAPGFTHPANGHVTNQDSLQITGTAAPGTRVRLMVNGELQPHEPVTGDNGQFLATVALEEGTNLLQAQAAYPSRMEFGALSAEWQLTRDTSVPDAPRSLVATSRPQGEISLSWGYDGDDRLQGFRVYRSAAPFVTADASGVTAVNQDLLRQAHYRDMPAEDGEYYYSVVAVNELGSESVLSPQVAAVADSEAPRIIRLEFTPEAPFDPISQRVGAGRVNLEVEFSEPLRNQPYLAFTVSGGTPLVATLQPDFRSDRVYRGHFNVPARAQAGLVYPVLSAHDAVGNRGSEVEPDVALVIDTQGPEVAELTLTPGAPINNDLTADSQGIEVSFTMRLDDQVKPGSTPLLVPYIHRLGESQVIAAYSAGIPLTLGEGTQSSEPTYHGTFKLPPYAGADEAGVPSVDYLGFHYSAEDDLGNRVESMRGNPRFQIYQGELPPADIPQGLTAKALPGGKVQLAWTEVQDAVGYRIYRRDPGEPALLERTELINPAAALYLDGQPHGLSDGQYDYALASVREHNGQQAVSALSEIVTVMAQATPPPAPHDLTVELSGNGVVLRWLAPDGDHGELTYNLYRLALPAGTEVPDLSAYEPLQTAVSGLVALDTRPSESEHLYVVTAVDEAGNESSASTSAYLDVALLPVSELTLGRFAEGAPVLSWYHGSTTLAGYEVYGVLGGETVKLHEGLLQSPHFEDMDFAGTGTASERIYDVVAVNQFGERSLPNRIHLPALSLSLLNQASGEPIKRGVMNRLQYRVANAGSQGIVQARLLVTLMDGVTPREHWSDYFSVEQGGFTDVPVVVGGYSSLGSQAEVDVQLILQPAPGQGVTLQQSQHVAVGQSALLVSLDTESFVRGATGQARIRVENPTDVEVEFITARSNGQQPSSEARFLLRDSDGNVLVSHPLMQGTGAVVTTPSGFSVARIGPGEVFLSQLLDVPVPESAPDHVTLHLEVDRLHYHLGRNTAVAIAGVRANRDVYLQETPYYGQLDAISAPVVFTGEPVNLQGRAVDRVTGQALASASLSLVMRVRGFERQRLLMTDAEGHFSYDFLPGLGDAGAYEVSVLHPSVLERPTHGQFLVEGAGVSPTQARVDIPRNYDFALDVRVRSGHGTELRNVRLVYLPQQGESGEALPPPEGITFNAGPSLNLGSNQQGQLRLGFSANHLAAAQGTLRFHVVADNTERPLDTVTVHYGLSEARPRLLPAPTHVDTGIRRSSEQRHTVTLTNHGLEAASNLQVSLVTPQGAQAPDWLRLLSPGTFGSVPVGNAVDLQLKLNPGEQVGEGNHEFRIRVTGSNIVTLDIPVYVSVTQSSDGSVLFHVADIYTATLDENSLPIPGLRNAQVTLQHEATLEEIRLVTDANGEALFADIPAGRYAYRASAFDHDSATGRLQVRPGITVREDVFLMNKLIKMEFSVREITLEDRYEIILEARFETDVPAPVVIFEPASVNLPMLRQGEVFQGEFMLTNYGLVDAENVTASLPTGDAYARFDYLGEIPDVLAARQMVVIHYRITALQDFMPNADGLASGGGCVSRSYEAICTYSATCAVGAVIRNSARLVFNAIAGSQCRSGGSGGNSVIPIYYGGHHFTGGGGGGSGGPGPRQSIGGGALCANNDCGFMGCNCGSGGGQ